MQAIVTLILVFVGVLREFSSKRFYVFDVRCFCELLSFNLYSNSCVLEFVRGRGGEGVGWGGGLCVLRECEAFCFIRNGTRAKK